MLSITNSFEIGSNVGIGLGFDSSTDSLFAYGEGGAEISNYNLSGDLIFSIASPGESANNFDLSLVSESLSLGDTDIPSGTLLVINGESGTTDIYAVDVEDDTVISTLVTEFGTSHVVGGSYHPQRDSFFLLQNDVIGGLIAEIDPIDGSIVNTFSPGEEYDIFSGDLEVNATTGNLFIVSSDETAIRELTPEGSVVRDLDLPDSVGDLSGIGLDEATGDIWVSNISGEVWQLNLDESPSEPLDALDGDGVPVYQFIRTDTQTQFYTTSEVERDIVIENLPNYELKGISFTGASVPEEDDLMSKIPVYRFFNTSTGIHLYTADEAERAFVEENLDNFVFEGTPYYGYDTQIEGTVPLYRFYNEELDAHFYTLSTEERDAFIASANFEPEGDSDGIAFYVEPASEV